MLKIRMKSPLNEFMNTFRVSPQLAMDLTYDIRDSLKRERSSGLLVEIQVTLQTLVSFC